MYICACMGFLLLSVVELIYWCGGKKEHFVWNVFPLPSPLLSTAYQCDGCLTSQGCGGSWLGCQVLTTIGVVPILQLATDSGSSRMSHPPTQPPLSDTVVNLPNSESVVKIKVTLKHLYWYFNLDSMILKFLCFYTLS